MISVAGGMVVPSAEAVDVLFDEAGFEFDVEAESLPDVEVGDDDPVEDELVADDVTPDVASLVSAGEVPLDAVDVLLLAVLAAVVAEVAVLVTLVVDVAPVPLAVPGEVVGSLVELAALPPPLPLASPLPPPPHALNTTVPPSAVRQPRN